MNSHPKAFEKDLGLEKSLKVWSPTNIFSSVISNVTISLSVVIISARRILTSGAVNFFFLTESIYSQNNHLIPFLWKKIKYIDKQINKPKLSRAK